MAQIFDSAMTAHVWAQFSQESGRTSNGNFYFERRALFSYGRHFVAGYLAPEPGNLAGVGVALLSSDSYSVSTSRHIGYAANATRGRGRLWVPNLTPLAEIFENARLTAAVRLNPGCYPTEYGTPDAAAFAAYCAKELRAHFSKPANVPGDGRNVRAEWTPRDAAAVVAQIFAAAGCDNPERRARAALSIAARVAAKDKADAAASAKRAALWNLSKFAAMNPATVRAEIERDAAASARESVRWTRANNRATWETTATEIFRACKVGKAAGQSARVRKASAVRAAIRASLGLFESYAERAARARTWQGHVITFRDGLRVAEAFKGGQETRVRVSASGTRHGSAYDVGAAMAAGNALIAALQGEPDDSESGRSEAWAARPAKIAGQNATRLAITIQESVFALSRVESAMQRAERMAAKRAELATVRAGVSCPPDAPAGQRAESFQGVVRIAGRYAARPAIGTYQPAPYYKIPAAWRVAGWTPGKFATLETAAKAAESVARAELKELAERETAAARAEALRIWRTGSRVPPELAKFNPRAMADGSAYIRATGIERDAGGNVTGGTLETSQGATVPLAHALRVFAFLRACRESGKAWHKNGRTLRVGHFNVDSVEPDGGFRAGCHKFAWVEIETLARALGLENIAPADTTESHAHA